MLRSTAAILLVCLGGLLSGCGYVHFGRYVPLQVQTELDAENASLRRQLAAAKAKAAGPPPYEELAAGIDKAALGERLATALHSYRLLEKENERLQKLAETLASEKTLLESQLAGSNANAAALGEQLTAAEATTRLVDTLRTQLRQTQDQLSALVAEHARLRTQLVIAAPAPGSVAAAPHRPAVVTAGALPTGAAPVDLSTPERVTHTVAEGETLSGIARRYYRDSQRWPEIFEANRDLLKDERSLRIGMQLHIP